MIPVSESKAGECSRDYSQDKGFRRDRDVQYSPLSIFVQHSKKKMGKDDNGSDMAGPESNGRFLFKIAM
jgi:hypothetical protein